MTDYAKTDSNRRIKELTITSLMFVAAVSILGFALRQFLADPRIQDLSGAAVSLQANAWQAVVVASVEDEAALVRALQSAASKRTKARNLSAIVFATDSPNVLRDYLKHSQPGVAVVSLHDNFAAARKLLNLEDIRTQLFLFDPNGNRVFHGGRPHSSDVKLLLQRFVPVPTLPPSPLKIGDRFTLSAVLNVRTGENDTPPPALLGIFFTGRCTSCLEHPSGGLIAVALPCIAPD